MSDVTPEQARAAADVLRRLNEQEFSGHDRVEHGVWAPGGLDAYADRIESEKAKRDKRIEELTRQMRMMAADLKGLATWEYLAEYLVNRYPSLLNDA